MKSHLIAAALALSCFSCEKTETTIIPVPEKKDTVIIAPAPKTEKKTETKTETETKIAPDGTTTEKTTTEEKK